MTEVAAKAAPLTAVRHQLINVIHHNKAMYHPDWFGKGHCILIVEKVTMSDGTRRKRVIRQADPTVKFMATAEEWREAHQLPTLSYPIERCDEYEVPYDRLEKGLAEITGQMDFYNETKGPGSRRRRQQLHGHRWLHGSDVNLTDTYIDRFMEAYKDQLDTTSPLDMAFADIEVDPIDYRGFPDENTAPCPVSLISYFHKPSKTLRLYANRGELMRPNPKIAEFEANVEEHKARILCEVNRGLLEQPRGKDKDGVLIKPLIPENCDWEVIAAQIGLFEGVDPDPETVAALRCTDVEIEFFDREDDTILEFLHRVNEIDRPDVLAWWNMRFDVLTLMNRLTKLGYDPEVEFTPQDFRPWALADYNDDTFNTEATDRGDAFTVTSYTIYVDQMLLYAQLRKQAGKKESYGLDFTLNDEINEGKYRAKYGIRELCHMDYLDFMIYGSVDVVPMSTLEEKTEDIALAYQISMVTRTRFVKIMKKTVCLTNLARVFYRNRGLALSNNRNRLKERTEGEKFRGAFVADPQLMAHSGVLIGGTRSNRVFEDVVDFDATSLYPSIILAFNIDTTGQIGRVLMEMLDGTFEDSHIEMEALACGDAVEIGRRLFKLPGLDELVGIINNGEKAHAEEAPV